MSPRLNEYGQPIGEPLGNWTARARPSRSTMAGRYCRLEPVDVLRHGSELYEAYAAVPDASDWTYMPVGPFPDLASYQEFLQQATTSEDPLHYAIIDIASGKAVGTIALMRITPQHGVVEIGAVTYSRALMRRPAATETMFLLMKHVFDELGYRRCEWKCDHLNSRSRQAALRYGFTFEGIFRQAIAYKGRSRDTAWFSLLDREWPAIRKGYEEWLAPANFGEDGRQRQALAVLIARAKGQPS